jgi:hypothetical protein
VRNSLIFAVLVSLAACGDPLADFERIEDVELADEATTAQALPDANDVAPTEGLFARIFNTEPAQAPLPEVQDDAAAAIAADVAESAGDAPSDIAAVDVVVPSAEDDTQVGGLRGWLKRAAAAEPVAAEIQEPSTGVETADTAADDLVEPAKRSGLLAGLLVDKDGPETVRTASLEPEIVAPAETSALAEPKKRAGLFGNLNRDKVKTVTFAADVPYGTVMPFGKVGRVCDAKKQGTLGRRLDKVPFHGRGYALYDSAPDSVSARTFYVTGFKDNCPRQFTAALALFGTAALHEKLRYGRPSKEYPYSATDQAYEKVKRSVCRVSKNKPCGAAIATMQKNTVFISTYEKFTDNARWADILLHDGAVVAASIKTP